MAQDDWHRITLRIPPDLHQRIVEAAKLTSVNSEIITRLERSFETPSEATVREAREEFRFLGERIRRLENIMKARKTDDSTPE